MYEGKNKGYNIEVQVALLKGGLYKKDLAQIFKVNPSVISAFFCREQPNEVQQQMINIINAVCNYDMTDEVLIDVKKMREYLRDDFRASRPQRYNIEKIVSFCEWLENENAYQKQHKEREIDSLCEKFL